MTTAMSKVARREVDPSEHTLALLEIIKERRQKENKLEKVGIVILNLFLFLKTSSAKADSSDGNGDEEEEKKWKYYSSSQRGTRSSDSW